MRKYNIIYPEMVKMGDVNWAIRKARKGIEVLHGDESEQAKNLAYAVLDDVVRLMYIDEIKAAKTQEDIDAILETDGDFIVAKVVKRSGTYFHAWDNGDPVFTDNVDEAMYFDYESMARTVAEKLGEGWYVVDMCDAETESTKRMLNAIFSEK